MGVKGLKLNYFRISKEMGRKTKSARIRHYIQDRRRGPRLHMSVPSYLSRYNLLARSTPAGVRTPMGAEKLAGSDPTGSVPGPHQAAEATVGGLQSIGMLPHAIERP